MSASEELHVVFGTGAVGMVIEASFVLDDGKFTRTTPLRDAIRETVAWYRAHHQEA